MELLVHACCCPCAIMPTKILAEQGHRITVHYSNSNIAPVEEYRRRLEELKAFAVRKGMPVIEGAYDPDAWERIVAPIGRAVEAGASDITREDRCRACYRMRLQDAARYAHQHGFEGLSTTLAVSPYQLRDVMHEELDAACAAEGLVPVFQDFTPYYREATRISRELGMYRQNYCGCRFSVAEAEQTRAHLRAQRKARKAMKAQKMHKE